MNPLLITTLFLVLLSLFSFNAQKRVTALYHLENIHQSRFDLNSLSRHLEQLSYFEKKCNQKKPTIGSLQEPNNDNLKPLEDSKIIEKKKYRKKAPPKSRPLKYDFSRPPKEARLNIKKVVDCKNSKKNDLHNHYQTLARLLRNLYKEHPLFQNSFDIEYQLIEELVLHSETIRNQMTDAEELSTLPFKSEEMQDLFYFILKGGSLSKINENGSTEIVYFPSLLSYISIHKFVTINLLFAPEELISAAIPYPDITNDIFTIRQSLWKQILEQESRRKSDDDEFPLTSSSIKQIFHDKVMETLSKKGLDRNEELVRLLNYELKKPGNLLVLRDEKTGILECRRISENSPIH